MISFELKATKNLLTVLKKSPLTSGSVNVNTVRFAFSPDWDGLDKRCVFRAGSGREIAVMPDDNGICDIPWEVLTEPGRVLYGGVYGTRGEEIVLPTVWADLGNILQGTYPGEGSGPPTPDAWQQLKDDLKTAESELEDIQKYTDAAVDSAERAGDLADAAEKSAGVASGAAAEAEIQAGLAGDSANSAAQSAREAETAQKSAEAAAGKAADAVTEQLDGYVQDAEAARNAAQEARAGAESARDDAEAHRDAAGESAAEAAQSADTAKQYSGNPAIIRDGTWWTWDADAQEYVDTGSPAKGDLLFPVFNVDAKTGELHMYAQEDYKGPDFRLREGDLEVVRNV